MRRTLGQSDAGAFEIVLAVQSLEDAKQFVGIVHVETNAVVPDKNDRFRLFDLEPISITAGLRGRLYFIALRSRLLKTCRSSVESARTTGRAPIFPFDVSTFGLGLNLLDCFLQKILKIGLRALHFRTACPGKIQQVVNQAPHLADRVVD